MSPDIFSRLAANPTPRRVENPRPFARKREFWIHKVPTGHRNRSSGSNRSEAACFCSILSGKHRKAYSSWFSVKMALFQHPVVLTSKAECLNQLCRCNIMRFCTWKSLQDQRQACCTLCGLMTLLTPTTNKIKNTGNSNSSERWK